MDVLDYSVRLRRLDLYYVDGRLLRADLIKSWTILHGFVDGELIGIFEISSNAVTRGHRFKFSIPRCRTEIRRRFFLVCVV